MASITLNGLSSPSILTFTDIPNILKVSESVSGSKSMITLNFLGNMANVATSNSQYYITVLDETVENVIDPADATNRRFIMKDAVSTAASVALALRNCASLYADFDITYSNTNVYITAREIGSKLNVVQPVRTNIGSSYLSYSMLDGTSSSNLVGGKLIVKVNHNGVEVTSLEKNWHGNSTSFDISPVLSTFANYGVGETYSLTIDKIGNDGLYASVGTIGNNIVTYGYEVNHSEKYLPIQNMILLNYNGMKQYTYFNTIPITVMSPNDSATASWTAYTSNMVQLGTGATPASPVNGYFADITVTVPSGVFSDAYYVDVHYGNSTVRFNVIKPLKAAEGATRVYWRNSYGGTSFMDFTGKESESNSTDTETYQENIYHLYDGDYKGERIYKNELTRTVTLTSHLIEKEGTLPIYDLGKSKMIWAREKNDTIYLIPDGIEVIENDTYNNIYQIRFRCRKS